MKKVVVAILSVLFVFSISAFFVACNDNKDEFELNLQFKARERSFYVGDSIDFLDMITYQAGVDYVFDLSKGDTKIDTVGRSFYAKDSGEYSLTCTAKYKEESKSDSTTFVVYDNKPFAMITGNDEEKYNSIVPFEYLTPTKITIESDSFAEVILNSVTVYMNPYVYDYYIQGKEMKDAMYDDIKSYDLSKASTDGLYDGENFCFMYEGFYVFDVEVKNAGGSVFDKYIVKVREDLSKFEENSTNEISYNYYESEFATWKKVAGATKYRVKVDYENVITDEKNSFESGDGISFNVSKYLSTSYTYFQIFDLVVIPLDASGNEIKISGKPSKITLKNVSVAPEEQKYAQFGNGTTVSYDETTKVATVNILGQRAKGLGFSKIQETDNGYVAWTGNFGIGNYIDIKFVGNNIPNVCLFADKINGNMTKTGGTGIIIVSGINGLYQSGGHYKTLQSSAVNIFGPTRMNGGTDNVVWDSCLTKLTGNDVAKMTQDYLSSDSSKTKYKYTVGSFEQGGYIYLDLRLYSINGEQETLLINKHVATNVHKTTLSSGNIIAFAPLKENAENSSFEFTTPYTSTPLAIAGEDNSVKSSGATFNADGSVTLKGSGLDGMDGVARAGYLANISASYIAWEGNYGVGNYVTFEFTGNNMPQVCFFADKINGSLVSYSTTGTQATMQVDQTKLNKGLLLFNGAMSVDKDCVTNYESGNIGKFQIWGPYRIAPQNGLADDDFVKTKMVDEGFNLNAIYSYTSTGSNPLNAFCQGGSYKDAAGQKTTISGLATTYKDTTFIYEVGTYNNAGKIYVKAVLKDKSTGTEIAKIDEDTGLSYADNYSGSIIAYSTIKGENRYEVLSDVDTTFKYTAPVQK